MSVGNSELIINSRYGKVCVSDKEDLIINSLKAYGEWADNEVSFLEKLINKGDTVLDVGTYLGTHLLAFGSFVGARGTVIGFEPQKKAYALVSETIKINNSTHLKINNFALGSRERVVDLLDASPDQINNEGSFSIFTSEQENNIQLSDSVDSVTGSSDKINIKTMDSLGFEHLDFIKIDAEGMEFEVLCGGENTLHKTRPLIYCECNDLEHGSKVYHWAVKNEFEVVAINIPAFNPDNYNKNSTDVFAGASEVALLLYPPVKESKINVAIRDMYFRKVNSTADIYLMLLSKKQFIEETPVLKETDLCYSDFNIADNFFSANLNFPEVRKTKGVIIGIPFYKGAELVEPLLDSFEKCNEELCSANARVVFYNDSPDDIALCQKLAEMKERTFSFPFEIVTNEFNLGFIDTTNKSIQYAVALNYDLVMLNSDTLFFPGVLSELIGVAYADPMIGFVSPRSNNATICTFPHKVSNDSLSPEDLYKQFTKISHVFPRYTFVPTLVGFCLFVKHKILEEFGLLDPVYGKGYNEENDFIMRANRCGYSAVLANHAYVWHEGEKSFSTLEVKRKERELENSKILNDRYPEFSSLVRGYFSSVEYRSEAIIEGLIPNPANKLNIAIDFSSLGTYHNGTFEAGKKLISAADKCWSSKYNIVIICSQAAWEYHKISVSSSERVSWCDPADFTNKFMAVVRIGQPFSVEALSQCFYRAPVASCFMLDTIATDCGYLKENFDVDIWRFILKWSDVIFTNSSFTASQFSRRYEIGDLTVIQPSLHSVTISDYSEEILPSDVDKIDGFAKNKRKLLVIGNKFEHKALNTSVAILSKELPDDEILVLGATSFDLHNVTCIPTGGMSDEEVKNIYKSSDAIIFPSHYEGFGFPLLHGLAQFKKVFLRNLPVYHEIIGELRSGSENVVFFESLSDLPDILKRTDLNWLGDAAYGEEAGWERSAKEVIRSLESSVKNINSTHVAERLRWFERSFVSTAYMPFSSNRTVAENIANRIYPHFYKVLAKVLNNRFIYRTLQISWRLYKKIR
ncbi:FkbM family methyltransferase [Escherichia coli]|uniref:FkbM family methyltransferase n=1 Tax=Citrobacter sp. Cb016 TaxID=2985015 RepID=UPI002579E68A|nr:FkbM family methyltransferase [Citrobacter sp. Cb016]ELX9580972.1 FkbM family methyltransferase [Escherichia coli]MDM3397782.1 FkbM family methyltransferase [Citrobacter sp. Cb016]